MALDQSGSPHTGMRTIQNTGVFWQAVFQPPRPHSLFLEHGSAAKTLISHPHNTASYAGYIKQGENENDAIRNRISDFNKRRISQPKTQ